MLEIRTMSVSEGNVSQLETSVNLETQSKMNKIKIVKQLGKTQRILIMLKILGEGRSLSTGRIATIMGVSERTVYRDMKDLREIDVPIEHEHGKYKLDNNMWDAWSIDAVKQSREIDV